MRKQEAFMAKRKIVQIGDEVLTKKSKKVEVIDQRILTLLDDMKDTLDDAEGIGLAAVQVGVLKRIVVIELDHKLYELINPVIVEQEGALAGHEGCLSIPGVDAEVTRPQRVVLEALDRHGKLQRYEGRDLLARAFCHETDHLDGILLTQRATRYFD